MVYQGGWYLLLNIFCQLDIDDKHENWPGKCFLRKGGNKYKSRYLVKFMRKHLLRKGECIACHQMTAEEKVLGNTGGTEETMKYKIASNTKLTLKLTYNILPVVLFSDSVYHSRTIKRVHPKKSNSYLTKKTFFSKLKNLIWI